MKPPRSRLLTSGLLLCVVLGGGCSPADNRLQQFQILALGTLIDISLWDVETGQADRVRQELEQQLHQWHHDWHGWQPGPLRDINQALANNQPARLSAEQQQLFNQAILLASRSDHLFNPAIGQLVALWGFHDDAPAGPPPAQAARQQLVQANPRMTDLVIDNNQLRSTNPAVQLDFGAFAKGVAIDRAIDYLKTQGIQHAIVNAGGDLRAIGRHGERLWRIGIRHPRQAGVVAALETQGDESVFTSGDYERNYQYEGQRYHHILDPGTGTPAHGALSVTVIHNEAATADAAATALFVAGPQHWRRIARQMGIELAMLIDEQLTVYMTPAMAQRLTLEQELKTVISE